MSINPAIPVGICLISCALLLIPDITVPSTCVPLWAECKATDQCCSGMCAGLAASDGLEAGPTVCIAADMSEIAAPSAVDPSINAKPKANPAVEVLICHIFC